MDYKTDLDKLCHNCSWVHQISVFQEICPEQPSPRLCCEGQAYK